MVTFTEAQIDKMSALVIRNELVALGEDIQVLRKMRVAPLRAMFKARLGFVAPPAQPPPPPPANSLNNASTPPALGDLHTALMKCGMIKETAERFANTQGLVGLNCLGGISPDDMEDTISRHNKAMTGGNEQYKIFSTLVIKKLEALVHGVRVFNLTGTPFQLSDFSSDAQINTAVMELEQFRVAEKKYTEPEALKDLIKEGEILGDKANEVFERIYTNLSQHRGAQGCGASLAYVVKDLTTPRIPNPTYAQRLTQDLGHFGLAFDEDNGRVFDILEKWAQGQKIYDHIKAYKESRNGRQAYLALKGVYLGKSSVNSALIKAQETISEGTQGVTYNGELSGTGGMPWADYIGALKRAYAFIQSNSGDTYSQQTMVKRLISGIKGDASQQYIITIACETVKDSALYSSNFNEAASYLQTKIQEVYAAALANKTKNNQSVKEASTKPADTGQAKGHGGGHGGGHQGHGGRGFNGRGRVGRGASHGRGSYHGRGGYGRGYGSGRGYYGNGRGPKYIGVGKYGGLTKFEEINGVDVSDVWKDFDSSVFKGDVRDYVLNRRRVESQDGGSSHSNSGNNNHNQARVNEIAMAISEVLTKRSNDGGQNPKGDKRSKGTTISQITTGARRISTGSSRSIKKSKVDYNDGGISTLARNELDSRADTCVLGANFRHLSDTGQVCNVNGFHGSFEQLSDIPIVNAATGWIHPDTGKLFILIINQGLWIPAMDHSLINPNQLRDFDVDVSDNPYDTGKRFGITHEGTTFIPFHTRGATVYFETFKPTQAQVDDPDNVKILLTESEEKKEWDPHAVNMSRHRARDVQNVSIMALEVAPDQDGDYTDSFDATLGSISGNYVPSVFAERVISSVVVNPSTATEFRSISATASTPRSITVNGRRVGINETFSSTRHSNVTAERASRLLGCSLEKARRTLECSTQKGVQRGWVRGTGSQRLMTRRYPSSNVRFQSEIPKLTGQFYMDWVKSNTQSIHGDTGAFYIGDGRYLDCYPKERHTSEEAARALSTFCTDVGTPANLKVDSAAEFTGKNSDFYKKGKHLGINITYGEPHRHEIGPIDVQIRENKKKWHESKATKSVPSRLWSYGITHAAQVQQVIPADGRRSGYEEVTGRTPDISELLDFGFYDLVWYWRGEHPSIGDECKDLGRWLGISKKVGTGMCYYILTRDGKVISESTVQHVTEEDMRDVDIRAKVEAFNRIVNEKLNDENYKIETKDGENTIDDPTHTLRNLARVAAGEETGNGDPVEVQEAYLRNVEDDLRDGEEDEFDQLDKLVGVTIKIDGPEGPIYGKVTKRSRDDTGKGIGKANKNPLLDTREYDVEMSDGTYEKYQANTIAENIFAQTDDEGRESLLLSEIYGHRKDGNAIPRSKGTNLNKYGETKRKITTAGWHIMVRWTDGSTDELPLSVVKESNPIQLAEYAVTAGITDEPAFAWWVPHALRTRNRIIKKARTIKKASKYWRTTSKFGIKLPKNVEEALKLDDDNGNHLWRDALRKEMGNVAVAFRKHEDHTPDQVRRGEAKNLTGFVEIKCHIVFDIKLDLTRKCRFVAGGHMTEAPACMTYSSVVSRESVRLAFLIAALNDLDISATDVGNAYLNAPCREKVWYEAGLEWGPEGKGTVMVIERALYGLKSSGAAWRAMFSDFIINQLGFTSTIVDQDVYRRRNTYKDNNGNTISYYELLLVYVDDVLVVSKAPGEVMEKISKSFRLKDGWDKPSSYLGAETFQHRRSNGALCWVLGSGKYVKNVIAEVKAMLEEDGLTLKQPPASAAKKQTIGPLHPDYKPELDTSPLLDARLHSRYQQIVGELRWAVELGRVDINVDVAILSQYLAAPREGHLEAVYDIIRYLSMKPDRRLLMSPRRIPQPDEVASSFNLTADWKEFYGEMKEEDPQGMPTPLGEAVKITTYLDANHANNVVTRRSHTGILIFVNSALIVQYSKKQNTVESATFGAEMVAMRTARDLTVALRIKLKMFGVPIDGPADFFCDNDSVVKNTSIPSSVLAKKHNSVNYHIIRESAAAGILRVAKIPTNDNKADALTKILPQYKRNHLLNDILYYPSEINDPSKLDLGGQKQPST